VILLTFGAWQRLFGGDRTIVGRPVILEGAPYLVVGVLPDWFHPDVRRQVREHEIWAPKVMQGFERNVRDARFWTVVGRVAAGRSLDDVQIEMATLTAQLAREQPKTMARRAAP
jgi:hypothetical protein